MLTVKNLAGQTEAINQYNGFEINEELNGSLTLSVISFFHADNPGHDLIEQESIVEYEGYEFRVKQLKTNSISKQISAISTYYDNADKRKYDIYGGTHTLDEFLTYVLAGTGWTFINEDVNQAVFIPDFGNDNVIKLVDILKASFECEMKIEPNKVVRFSTQLGPDNDAQYRYGHNIRALSENIDTTKLKTYIEGFGADDLHVSYTSPNESVFGRRDAEPVYDDRFSIADSLLERMKQDLIDYPETSIELDAIELQDKEIGERVWLIHEKLGIEYQTRIMAKRTRIPKTLSSVVLGNRLPQNLSNYLTSQKVEIDRNKKETRSKFEQTNEYITLEVERVDESIATLTLEADEIQLNVTAIDGRLGTAESNISVQAGQISQRVSYTDYNGYTVASMLNQTAFSIELNAQMIDLLGITNVSSALFVGTQGSMEEKGIYFRDNASIYSPNGTGEFHIENLGGYTYLYNSIIFGTPSGTGATVDFSQASVIGLYPTFG